MQDTLTQDNLKIQDTDCTYDCLIGIETCPEMRSCEIRKKLNEHINSRFNKHKDKARNTHFIEPPVKSDIAIVFRESLNNNGFTCKYCGTHLDMHATQGMIGLIPAISLDHIIPLSSGGNNKLSNLQLICHRCNTVKHTVHPDYFDAIVFTLKERFGVGGVIKYMDAIYPALFNLYTKKGRDK